MSTAEFAPLIAILLTLAPPNWVEMRATYRYDQAARMSDVTTHAVTTASNQQWVQVGHTTFDMMDFFDTYRAKTHAGMAKPWTSVTVTVKRGGSEPMLEFGYEVLDLTQR